MADKITGYTHTPVERGPSKARAASDARETGRSRTEQPSAPAQDAVSVSDTATRLKAAEARLAQQPEVDAARVSEMREKIESGDYRVDSQAVAEKLLQLDQSLS